jgi:hypothetical protein
MTGPQLIASQLSTRKLFLFHHCRPKFSRPCLMIYFLRLKRCPNAIDERLVQVHCGTGGQ